MIGRLLGIDYGEKRVGLALSDPTQTIARPFEVLERTVWERDIARLETIVKEEMVIGFVVGLPRNTDGTDGPMVKKVEDFVARIRERLDLPVYWVDETYTSIEADELLREHSKDWRRRKEKIDMVAAQIILRTWLDSSK